MENSDLFSSFLDECHLELVKPASGMIWERVQAAWECAAQQSSAPEEVASGRFALVRADLALSVQLQRIINAEVKGDKTLPSQVNDQSKVTSAVDLLSLTVNFEFPFTVIFGREILSKYELLFRFLLRLIFLERELISLPPITFTKSFCILRRQMLHLIQNVRQYLIFEVIEAGWSSFLSKIQAAIGLDEILHLHTGFIDSCLRQSMLSNAKLLQILNLLFTQCNRLLSIHPHSDGEFNVKVSTIGGTFCKGMKTLLEALQYYSSRDYDYHLGTLFSRLDYNSFYFANSFGASSPSTAHHD